MKKLSLLVILVTLLSACGSNKTVNEILNPDPNQQAVPQVVNPDDRFYKVESGGTWNGQYNIYVDRVTGCQYITKNSINSGFSPIIDETGKPLCVPVSR